MEMFALSTWHMAGAGPGAGTKILGANEGEVGAGVVSGAGAGATAGADGQLTGVGGVCTAAQ